MHKKETLSQTIFHSYPKTIVSSGCGIKQNYEENTVTCKVILIQIYHFNYYFKGSNHACWLFHLCLY